MTSPQWLYEVMKEEILSQTSFSYEHAYAVRNYQELRIMLLKRNK